jgi:hypothetical protein
MKMEIFLVVAHLKLLSITLGQISYFFVTFFFIGVHVFITILVFSGNICNAM